FWRDVEIKAVGIAERNVARDVFADAFVGYDATDKREHGDDEENFSRRDPAAGAAFAAGDRPFVKLDSSPENKNERPPMAENSAEAEAGIIVQKEQRADGDEYEGAENPAGSRFSVGHVSWLSLPLIGALVGRRWRIDGRDGGRLWHGR